jgi:outer membrane protein OmpA-like peptidoglycan-associated protein
MKVTYKGLGITNVSLIGDEVVVETAPTFSGKTSAIVVLTQGKQITKITIPVTVTPDSVSNAKFTPVSDSSTQVTWDASKNATAYSVYLNDRLTCSGKDLSCEIGSLLGPNAVITVKARGGGSTISDPVLAAYAAGEHINVAMVNFDTGKYNLTASAIRVLKSTAKLIKEQGFQHIYVSGHVDIRPGLDDQILSDNRAQSTRDYLQSLLPGIEIQIRGFGSTEPLALGLDPESLAENRRAQISIW